MFKSKKKDKNENSTSTSGTTSRYSENRTVATSNSGHISSETVTRQISSHSVQSRSSFLRETVSRFTSSADSIVRPNSRNPLSSLGTDAVPFNVRHALHPSSTAPSLGSPTNTIAQLPSTSSNRSIFSTLSPSGTTSNALQPRSTYSKNPPRNAFTLTTFASYPSRSMQSPVVLASENRSVIPTYSLPGPKRGRALIINNIKFLDKKSKEREGAQKDSEDLKTLLRTLGYEVEDRTNLKAKDMFEQVKKFSKSSFSKHDMSLVVMMSHGHNTIDKKPVKGGYTEIMGIDDKGVPTEDIIDLFTADKCHPTLIGKPKIFIFQCCRGEFDQKALQHDVSPIASVPKRHSDILIAYSTIPGFVSNREPEYGTWYIQSICKVFYRHYKDHDIENMLKIVDNELSNRHPVYKQTSTYENRGFKRCFLYPVQTN